MKDKILAEAERIARQAALNSITNELTSHIEDLYRGQNVRVVQIVEIKHSDQLAYVVVQRHNETDTLISVYARHKDDCFVSMDMREIYSSGEIVFATSLDALVLCDPLPPSPLPTMEMDMPQIVEIDDMPYHLNVFGAFWRWLSGRGL